MTNVSQNPTASNCMAEGSVSCRESGVEKCRLTCYPEDGGSMFIINTCLLQTVLYLPSWEPQIRRIKFTRMFIRPCVSTISASTFSTHAPTRLSLFVCGGHYHSDTIRRHRAVLGNAPNTAVQYARWIVAAGIIQLHIASCPLYGQPAKSYKGNKKRNILHCTCLGSYL